MIRRFLILSLVPWLLCACPALDPITPLAMIEAPQLSEISGLAVSPRDPDLLWALNDGGNGAYLYALGRNGQIRGQLTVSGIGNRDWEDLAAFHWDGDNWLLVAEVGDNNAHHDELRLYLLREPVIDGDDWQGAVTPAHVWRFVYPDGPRDCESIAVDTEQGEILIMSKRDQPARLYTLPLQLSMPEALRVAEYRGNVDHIPPPSAADELRDPLHGRWSSQPTALDLNPAGNLAAVLTYRAIYLYPRQPGQSWSQAFTNPPGTIALTQLRQAEALTFTSNQELLVTSEKLPAPLYRIKVLDGVTQSP
ncbi:MAG: hypothetical protein Tsb002_09870 [Wenzhouxiangellaceae bacterium]